MTRTAPGSAHRALRWAAATLLAAACGGSQPASHAVEIRAFRFLPDTVEVAAGDTVVWTNHDLVPHTASGPRGAWDSGRIDARGSARWVAGEPGTHEYLCAYHPTMRAVVVVR